MALDFLDALIAAIGTGASAAPEFAPELLGLGGAGLETAAEFTPELAQLGMAGTEAAASAAPSVVESAAPSFMAAGAEFGPEFGPAPDAAPNQASSFYAPPPDANPNAVTGPGGVGLSGTSGDQSLEMASPGSQLSALSGMNVAPQPNFWETAQQIPGKWWQIAQNAPTEAANYVGEHPFKTAAGVASLGIGAYNAANPPEAPKYPGASTFNFGPAAAPSSASASPDVPPGPPRSPLTRGSRGGMNVKPSPGIRQGAGAMNV